jgi:hypothetical protein
VITRRAGALLLRGSQGQHRPELSRYTRSRLIAKRLTTTAEETNRSGDRCPRGSQVFPGAPEQAKATEWRSAGPSGRRRSRPRAGHDHEPDQCEQADAGHEQRPGPQHHRAAKRGRSTLPSWSEARSLEATASAAPAARSAGMNGPRNRRKCDRTIAPSHGSEHTVGCEHDRRELHL